jgi:hypothetical protein
LKKKTLSEKQEGKKPQVDTQVEEGPFPKIIKLMLPLWRNQMRIKGRE